MRRNFLPLTIAAVLLGVVVWTACNRTNDAQGTAAASANNAKLPITTKSDEARKEFLEGRSLAEKLQAQDSLQHFDKAAALDPDFATAELARANASATAKEFFEHMNKAVAAADKASEGERLLILANQAGGNGELPKQKQYLDQLLAKYPNDERVHFAVGGYYFGQQDFLQAIEHYKKATELAPDYSPAYNILGYAYRQQGDYANAEQAFQKYIQLIPNDPNPYDSYAELLLKMGRFDDSIVQYRNALAINPHFFASHLGISADLMYLGKPDEAAAELNQITANARNDGERRAALFGLTVVAADSGKMNQALVELDKQYSLGEKTNDVGGMVGDLQNKGNVLEEMQKYDAAQQQYVRLLELTEKSNLSQPIKDNTQLFHHFNLATVAIGKKDYAAAKQHADEFGKGAEASGNAFQVRQSHELNGRIALAQKDYDTAIAELLQANQQNPSDLFRLCQAYQGKGDDAKAREYCKHAADFNSLPLLNTAFVRAKAKKMAGTGS